MDNTAEALKEKIDNTKVNIINALEEGLQSIEDRISADLMSLELAVLYTNRIYGKEARDIQQVFNDLADNIDHVMREHRETLFHSLQCVLDELNDNVDLTT